MATPIPIAKPSSTTDEIDSVHSTPDSAGVITPLPSHEDDSQQQVTPQPKRIQQDGGKGKMLPPPVPVSIVAATPPVMTRMPSLRQLTDRLHPSPTQPPISPKTPNFTNHNNTNKDNATPTTPPKSLSTNNNATNLPPLNTSPFAPSPNSRLKLPPSAMMRSLSSQGKEDLLPKSPTSLDGVISMSRSGSREGYVRGYKDVPSLGAIRQRMSVSRGSSFTGSIREQEAVQDGVEASNSEKPREETAVNRSEETVKLERRVEQPADIEVKAIASSSTLPPVNPGHPLRHTWTLYYDSKTYKPDPIHDTPKPGDPVLADYEKGLLTVGKIDTVETFARYFNNVRLPSQLARNSNYHLFKNGIKPMWEDPANANGGKWVILFRSAPHLLDEAWSNLLMSLIGEVLDPEDLVCGIVASTRPKIDRVQLWTRGREDVEGINRLGARILEGMMLEGRDAESMSMEFQYNASNSTPQQHTFLHIPFSNRTNTINANSHVPLTPSRLSVSPSMINQSGIFAQAQNEHLQLPPSHSPSHGGMGPRRLSAGQGVGAFAGPMGGVRRAVPG